MHKTNLPTQLLIQSGVVIGETAVVGDGTTILHGVTLGGTGKDHGDRHPKIGKDVLIGAGTKILGNVSVGDRCKIGAGSVVLRPIPSGATAVGAPAKILGFTPGKSAFVLFYHVHMCVQCEVLLIWLLHLSLHCIHLLALSTHMH